MAKSSKSKSLSSLNDTLNQLNREIASLGAEIKTQITGNLQGADEVAKQLAKTTGADIARSLREMAKGTNQIANNQDRLKDGSLKQKDIAKQIQQLTKTEQQLTERLNDAVNDGFILDTHRDAIQQDIVANLKAQKDELNEQLNLAKKLEKAQRQQERTIKGVMKITKELSSVPLVGRLIDASKVQERMTSFAKKYQEEHGKAASSMRIGWEGVKGIFQSIGDKLFSPAFILGGIVTALTAIVKLVLDYENKTFEIAKNLGVSVTHADKLRNTFREMAMTSANAGLSSSEIAESYGKMSEQMGFLAPTGRDFAETATKLEKRIGASAEQMSALASFGALSGKNLTQAYKTAVASATVGMARNKIALSEKQILDGISKVSSAVLINFKGNLAALTEAVVRAKKLGTTLDQVAKQGDSLLDFETSIGNEFEAQVLTGKDINLVKARELALMGDTRGLMEELNKQNMTFGEYSEMNIIQRQSFAQALGLSNEELSKQLLLQQQANQLGAVEGQSVSDRYQQLIKEGKTRAEIGRLIGDSAEAELNRASAAEELNKTIENMKEQLAYMLKDTILPMVRQVTDWLKNSVNIEKVAGVIKGIFEFIGKAISNLPDTLNKVATALKIIASLSIASAVANLVGGLAMGGPAGAIAGIAAGIGAYALLTSYMPKFADGGIVGGTSESGDTNLAAVNSGEMILNKPQQAQLFKIANGGGAGGDRNINLTVNTVVDGGAIATTNIKHTLRSHDTYLDSSTGQY